MKVSVLTSTQSVNGIEVTVTTSCNISDADEHWAEDDEVTEWLDGFDIGERDPLDLIDLLKDLVAEIRSDASPKRIKKIVLENARSLCLVWENKAR